ncbi:MotA/TolQ/ExbB proton channel family protein [Chelativorans sp. AA-79]|uniref:MotA/TolQ/ExbB proton channel family protein n=1 Tax=Chelativorans sp. AA-79 TaxID=3028735 RepID=UPI0023F9E6C3|nr:MotA/TolQ/ExbB proton channel family protein [Chelativorans sp. AA-79]WEX10861.1 MotA/TolQ/ExbB proton channel family protein [Chelativorans sp. AA-79]
MRQVIIDQLLSAGGPVFVALVLTSVAALAVTIFKVLQFSRLGVGRSRAARSAVAIWAAGDRSRALQEARSEISPSSAAVASAMISFQHHPGDHQRARELAVQSAADQLTAMSRHMRVLESVVQAAPMLGLLGTVIGMISAFAELSAAGGAVDPSTLAGGIWTALLTTAAGLSIAIPFYFVSVWLESRIDDERATMEAAINAMLYSETGGAPPPAGAALPAGLLPQGFAGQRP